MKSRKKRRWKWLKILTLGVCFAIAMSAVWNAWTYEHPGGDPARDSRAQLPEFENEELTPGQRALVERYAPVIYQGASARVERRYWDHPTRLDFDGDWEGRNNEQSLASWPQETPFPAAVYYALVESETHVFLTYFLFHPLDWESTPNLFWVGRWHENDGESVQVVVRKRDGKALLLATQAHLDTHLYVAAGETVRSRSGWSVEDQAMQMESGRPVVYVESGGHGIYGVRVKGRAAGSSLLAFRPPGYELIELSDAQWTDYELVPIHDTLWKMYRTRTHLGDGGMLDGSFDYRSAVVDYRGLPRHFDSDRLSVLALWKFDAGVVPFAFSHSLLADDLGVLFFEPARKYVDAFEFGEGKAQEQWGHTYLYNPYLPAAP